MINEAATCNVPVYEYHDGVCRAWQSCSRTCYVQVQALELVMLEDLRGGAVIWKVEQFLLIVLRTRLRTDGTNDECQTD